MLHGTRTEIPVSKLEPNKWNPNVMPEEEWSLLLQDMKMRGPKHNLAIRALEVSPKNVFYNDPEAEEGVFVIIDGEHRWKAAQELGWESLKCDIHCISEYEGQAMNYRRNRERGHLDPLKEAGLFKSDIDRGLKQQNVALKYGVSRSYVGTKLGLIKVDEKVVEIFREPEEAFKERQIEKYEKKHAEWRQRQEENEGYHYMSEPEKPDEEDLVPRGTISGSHLEAISTLPEDKQVEVAHRILSRDLNVRDTEEVVRREKAQIARQRRVNQALAKAKRKKCPACGSEPEDFAYSDETRFKCSSPTCWEKWEYMKTAKEVKVEREAAKSEADKKRSEKLREKFKEARENPAYIRLEQTPEELNEKVTPWLVRKVHEMTEIYSIQVKGKRGDDDVRINYVPPSQWGRMNLAFQIRDVVFGFNVEKKEYKKLKDKCRVNMYYSMGVNEESREAIRRFFTDTINTKEDPLIFGDPAS